MRRTAGALAAVGVFLALGCAKKGDPVQAALDRMVKAANARDAATLFENVAPDFQAADGSSRSDAEALVHRIFAAYEVLNVTIRDVHAEKGESAARVRFTAEMSGQPLKMGGAPGTPASFGEIRLRSAPDVGWQDVEGGVGLLAARRGLSQIARAVDTRAGVR